MNNKFLGVLLIFVWMIHQISCAPLRKASSSSRRLVKVATELDKSNTSGTYRLEFTNISYKLVCQVKFRIELPKTASLAEYWNMHPVYGTEDEFTLSNFEQISAGQAFADAGFKLDGTGEPKILITDTVNVLSTKRCPSSADDIPTA